MRDDSSLTVAEIMQRLEDLLAEDLGVQPNGAPAIFSEPPIPDTTDVTGLCCILRVLPIIREVLPATGNQKYIDETVTVTLFQFDRTQSVLNSVRKILQAFPIHSVVSMPGDEEFFESVKIRIWRRGFI